MQHLITRITHILHSPRGALGLFAALVVGTAAVAEEHQQELQQVRLCIRVPTASPSRERYPRPNSCRVGTGSCTLI